MKKKRLWIVLGIALLILVTSLFLVHTLFRLGIAQLKIRETLEVELSREFDREVRIGDLGLGPFLNLIELREVKVAAGKDLSSGTLFEARKLRLHLDLFQLFHRTLFIKRISILEPRLLAEFDAHGASPLLDLLAILAAPPKRPRPVKLEVSQILVYQGELHYRDARTYLAGEGKGIIISLNFHPFGGLKGGSMEVAEAKILYRDEARRLKNLKGMWKLEEGDLSLPLLQAELEGSNISITGKVASLYKGPALDLQVRSSLDVASLLPSQPFKGTLQVDASVKGPLERPLAQGSVRTAKGSLWKIEVQDGEGEFRWSPGKIEIHRLSARALGGEFQGTLLLDFKREVPLFQAYIETRDLDLSRAASLIENARGLSLRGKLQAGLDIQGRGWIFGNLEGKGWARARDIVLPGIQEGGRMEAVFRLSPGVFTINRLALIAPFSEVLVSGKVTGGRDLSISLETRSLDLRSLAAFDIREAQGLLKLKGNISGRIEDPVFRGNIEIQGPRYKGIGFQRLAGPLELVSRRLSLPRLTLRQGATEVLVKGSLQLPKKGEAPGGLWGDSIMQLDMKVTSGKAQDALSSIGWDLPIEGTFGLRGSISGRPSRLKGQASVSMTGATFWEEPAWAGEASLSLEGERLMVEGFSFHRDQEKVAGKGEANLSGDYSFEINTSPLNLARVKVLQGGQWVGLVRLSARGKGSFQHPQLQGELSLTNLAYKGLPLGDGEGTFSFKNQELRWESSLSDGAYRLNGSLKTTGARPYHLEAFLQKGELGPLFAAIEHPFFQGAKGKAQGRMEFSGNLRGTSKPRGKAYFSMVELTFWGETLQNDKPVELSLEDGLLRFESFRLKGEGSAGASAKATVQGALSPGKEWDFSLDGELGLSLLQGLFSSIQGAMGRAQVSLMVKGPWKHPELKGVIQVRNGGLWFQDLPVPFEGLSGTLTFEKEGANLSFVEARLGGGRFTAWGKSKKTGAGASAKGSRYDLDFKLEGAEAAEIIKGKGGKEGTVSGKLNARGKLGAFGDGEAELWGSLEGQVSIEMLEGRIRRYTLLAKIFSILNVAQLLELKLPDLFTEGMKYKSWKGDFLIKKGVAETDNFFLDSDSMKITAIGKIDLARGSLDLTVGVQPLQTIDKVISNIPILGYILTGKEKSLISAYFEVKGPWDDPTVKPIPLKSLGRGILGIFRRFLEIPERLLVPGK